MEIIETDIKVTECRAVVAYCDVTGFMSWVKRSTAFKNDVKGFIRRMKFLFLQFRLREGYVTLPIGDGIIPILIDMDGHGNLLKFLNSIIRLQKDMEKLITDETYPRPLGFRVRVTSGIIYRIDEPPLLTNFGDAHAPVLLTTDFIGDCLNLGSRLLQVRREIPNMIHQSAMELLSLAEREALNIKKVTFMERPPRGVDVEDMTGLATFGTT